MHGLRAAVRAVTIERRANDKDRVRVDVVWTLESVNDPRHYVGIWYRLITFGLACVYTHRCTYRQTGKFDMIIHYNGKAGAIHKY